jgi:hypothetical protein
MRIAKITPAERAFLASAVVAACLAGGLAGYSAYDSEAEAQFHGGVLPEDALEAKFTLAWQFASAFLRWGGGIALLGGVVPVTAWRVFKRD